MRAKLIIWAYIIVSSAALFLLCAWLDEKFPSKYQPQKSEQCLRLTAEKLYCLQTNSEAPGLARVR